MLIYLAGYIFDTLAMFRKHQLLYHSGLIPYHKYRNSFMDVLGRVKADEEEKAEAAKKKQKPTQEQDQELSTETTVVVKSEKK